MIRVDLPIVPCDACRDTEHELWCKGAQEMHTCPFGHEIHGNLDECNCCARRERRCADDV